MTPTVHLVYVTPPQELCQIVAWRFHQAVDVFTLVLILDVHNMHPQESPQNLCVAGGSSALYIRNNFPRCPFSQETLSGVTMFIPG